jgi:hypothetical protein
MAWFAAALPYISAGVSVASTIGQASAQEQMAEIEAAQLRKQSIADTASSVQDAKQEKRKSEILKSRVTALSAKSGSSGMDVDRIISDIDEQGEYNSLAALYSGQTSASSKRYAADVAVARGKSQKQSGYFDAASTIMGSMDKQWGRKA